MNVIYDTKVTGMKQFLPAGPVAERDPPSSDGLRKEHLIQLFTDTGIRTLSVASIRLKDPRKQRSLAA